MGATLETVIVAELVSRECELRGCERVFHPKVEWQRFCSKAHAAKASKLRRQVRIKAALKLLANFEENNDAA
jgi:hypothetical protein